MIFSRSVEKTCDALERLLRLVLALEDCCRGGGQGAPDLLALLRSHLMLFRNVMNMARKGDVVTGEVGLLFFFCLEVQSNTSFYEKIKI